MFSYCVWICSLNCEARHVSVSKFIDMSFLAFDYSFLSLATIVLCSECTVKTLIRSDLAVSLHGTKHTVISVMVLLNKFALKAFKN